MRPSRGMGDMMKSKMPGPKTIKRKDNPDDVKMYAKGNWIAGAVQKKGALRAAMGVKGDAKIPTDKLAAAAKKPGIMGKRARLVQTFAKMRKK